MTQKGDYTAEEIKEIGRRIKTRRTALRLSQRELGNKVSRKKDVIQRLESGNLKSVNINLLYHVSNYLDCNPDYLLLQTDDPRVHRSNEPQHYDAPSFQHTAESFLYHNLSFKRDITYISKYMHKDIQEEILHIVHTIVTLHKCGVHFPNVSPEDAAKVSFHELDQSIKNDFWEKYTTWKYPK